MQSTSDDANRVDQVAKFGLEFAVEFTETNEIRGSCIHILYIQKHADPVISSQDHVCECTRWMKSARVRHGGHVDNGSY